MQQLNDQLFRASDSLRYHYQAAAAANYAGARREDRKHDESTFSALESLARHYKTALRQMMDSATPLLSSDRGGDRPQSRHSGRPPTPQSAVPPLILKRSDIDPLLDQIQYGCCHNNNENSIFCYSHSDLQSRVVAVLNAVLRVQMQCGDVRSHDSSENRLTERLWDVCQAILKDMAKNGVAPSTVLLSSLAVTLKEYYQRKKGQQQGDGATQLLVLLQLVQEAQNGDNQTDDQWTVVWNMYLSSLCDQVLETRNPAHPNLEKAAKFLLQPLETEVIAKDLPTFEPDVISFNTVLDVAAKVGNQTIIESLWNHMKASSDKPLQPDVRSYNARLAATPDPTKQLEIFDTEMFPSLHQSRGSSFTDIYDAFTIDLLLGPLVRAGRTDDLYQLIERWIASTATMEPYRQRKLLQDKFCAFLNSATKLNDGGRSARDLFSRFVIVNATETEPTLDSKQVVLPERRHFNVLLEAYASSAHQALQQIKKHSAMPEASRNFEYLEMLKSSRDTNVFDAKQLYDTMIWLNRSEPIRNIFPDDYTWSTMTRCCNSSKQVAVIIKHAAACGPPSPVVVRSAIDICGLLEDPSMACILFEKYGNLDSNPFANKRSCNVLLNALADGAKLGNTILSFNGKISETSCVAVLEGLTCTDAVLVILEKMREKDSRTYCNAAAAMQYASSEHRDTKIIAMELFRNATKDGVPADGRLLNAIIRCFGDDIDSALKKWKMKLRPACISLEYRDKSGRRRNDRELNLLAAYDGLVYVCGRAERPDIAVRIAYAMRKEGIELSERTFNSYMSGKRRRQAILEENPSSSSPKRIFSTILPRIRLTKEYEDLLYVECKKYDTRDRRTEKDKRVKIIV
jgi:Pentatricopeptide repeat domain